MMRISPWSTTRRLLRRAVEEVKSTSTAEIDQLEGTDEIAQLACADSRKIRPSGRIHAGGAGVGCGACNG